MAVLAARDLLIPRGPAPDTQHSALPPGTVLVMQLRAHIIVLVAVGVLLTPACGSSSGCDNFPKPASAPLQDGERRAATVEVDSHGLLVDINGGFYVLSWGDTPNPNGVSRKVSAPPGRRNGMVERATEGVVSEPDPGTNLVLELEGVTYLLEGPITCE
jgi:hypothetical protein